MKTLIALLLLIAPVMANDLIPSAWNIKIDLPGLLAVGAQYCTFYPDNAECHWLESENGKLSKPVQILAMAPHTYVPIIRMNESNWTLSAGYEGTGHLIVIYQGHYIWFNCFTLTRDLTKMLEKFSGCNAEETTRPVQWK